VNPVPESKESPFAVIGKFIRALVICCAIGALVGVLASSALSPLIGTPKAIAVGIAITIVGSLLMIQFSVAKYFGFTTKE